MLFSSMTFLWIFLPLTLLMYNAVKQRWQNLLLVLVSFVFYGWGGPQNLLLIFFSILLNFGFGLWVEDAKKGKSILLTVCVLLNLGILFYYKYFAFVYNSAAALFNLQPVDAITLPIGISFFTFQALSYVVDVYRGTKGGEVHAQRSLTNLALYVSFFPQLIAGPIVKYHDFHDQLNARKVTRESFAYGVKRFIIGLSKKVLISNAVAVVADAVFALDAANLGTATAWLGILCYTLQIYYDFSGYSDMAIGLGKMMGFTFMENFNYPYLALSIRDFWRRWHISLSTWFREYLYIPLGGNRKGAGRTYINLFIVFLATGIWHGANWTFVVWGLFHGLFSIFERKWMTKEPSGAVSRVLHWCYAMLVVMVGWVIFRADSMTHAFAYLAHMFSFTASPALYSAAMFVDGKVIAAIVAGVLMAGFVQMCIPRVNRWILKERKISYVQVVALAALMILCILNLASDAYNPFIYFRF